MILCAALMVKLPDIADPVVVPCHRHGEGMQMLHIFDPEHRYKIMEQGFITTDNRFMNRVEALKHAVDCGQLSVSTLWYKADRKDNELYSEDLY